MTAPPATDDDLLREAIELLFFAYRDFTGEPDAVLANYGFGRAHHRVIYFVGRHPGITVGELLEILQITKQSLSRVLRTLVKDGFIAQLSGATDRRLRHLHLTAQGEMLKSDLSAPQKTRLRRAFDNAGPEARDGFRAVMKHITDEKDHFNF